MLNLLYFIIVLSILIFVHEFGHFLVARLAGVKVITFSLGFGKKLLSFKRGETEYAVSAVPSGGYVKMLGESTEDVVIGGRGFAVLLQQASAGADPDRFCRSLFQCSFRRRLSFFVLFLTGYPVPSTTDGNRTGHGGGARI